MSVPSARVPVVFDPSMEHLEEGEQETTRKIAHTLHEITATTSKDYGHAVRSVHAKSHALLNGQLTVADNLPPELAQGLFAKPAAYPVVMRISTAPGDVLPDSISAPRGVAIKVLEIPGERLTPGDSAETQDFLMVDGPTFAAPSAKAFAPSLALLAKTVDKAVGLKKVLSTVLQALEGAIETVGGESVALEALGGKRNTNPLGETFFSGTPFLYGKYIAKFSLAPVSANMTALTGKKIEVRGRSMALREEIASVLRTAPAAWELRVQLCLDLERMPIERADVDWDQKLSPYLPVARIETAPQESWTLERSKTVDDGLAFDVWHCLKAHRPLGSINRVRKMVYPMSSGFRRSFNGCPMHEPRSVELK